ncbi:TetR/AcrR family transcriptional regulator [Dyella choica]|uniref:TetR/AcrR family transcriptional regulator n=1 Tax=Dyella choica TaxID=1927959 RepID=A0A3S0PMF9_9GAMM|nr:TetR/AcrR family transcriptional regulator [Dyella choica]RUL75978.1 TetR/AcrR family transcriptional regulator [Dyella choica]
MTTRIPAKHRAMRKAPKQLRSQSTVEGIVEAGARVLAQRGWAKFTTNEVARVAGASIGSLYQYFPNKLAIAEAIRQRHLSQLLAVLPDPGKQGKALSLNRHVDQLIDGVVAAHSINQKLHRILLDEVPLAARSFDTDFEREYLHRYEILTRVALDDGARNLMAARILADAVEGIVHAAASREELGSSAVRIEVKRMVSAYLLALQRA